MMAVLGTASGDEFMPFSKPVHGFALVYLLAACAAMGFILNRSRWAIRVEWLRHVAVLGVGSWALLADIAGPTFSLGVGGSLLSLALFGLLRVFEGGSERSGTPMFEGRSGTPLF
jgi:hypothetical protein